MNHEILMKILSGDAELANQYTPQQIEQELNLYRKLLTKEL